MAELLAASKNAFSNVRPGRIVAWLNEGAKVDAARHPATARYAKISSRYSTAPALPDLWQKGYDRFGDEFEAALSHLTSQKPTEYASALLGLDDLWKLVGLQWSELADYEQLAWEHSRSDSRIHALPLVARRQTPDRFPDMLEWSGVNRVTVEGRTDWATNILYSAFAKVARVRKLPRRGYPYRPTTEELLELIDAGVTPAELYDLVLMHGLDLEQARLHVVEGIPLEYVLAVF